MCFHKRHSAEPLKPKHLLTSVLRVGCSQAFFYRKSDPELLSFFDQQVAKFNDSLDRLQSANPILGEDKNLTGF